MFGSQALEVAIGLILVFLLVSLILTAVRESIEGWFKTRALDLERAIAELLEDREGTGLRKAFYDHPLISALYPGGYQATRFDANGDPIRRAADPGGAPGVEGRSGRNPSYIPRRHFALALMDLAGRGQVAGRAAVAMLAMATATKPETTATMTMADDPAAPVGMDRMLGDRLGALVGQDAQRVRLTIEAWYDGAMDRASGWYRRRTQTLLFWMGLGVAVALNVNAFTIGQALATDPELLAEVMVLAERVDAAGPPAPGPPAPEPAAPEPAAPEPAAPGAVADDAVADDTADDAVAVPEAGAEEVLDLQTKLIALGLPIGWDRATRARLALGMPTSGPWRGGPDAEWTAAALLAWLLWALTWAAGFLVTGFAATLGAPFWFDVLNKFMVVRSTVKPSEKSGDEGGEDRAPRAAAPAPVGPAGGPIP